MFPNIVAYLPIVLIAGLAILGIYLRLPSVKGRRGETRVERELRRLDPSDYRVFHDLLLEAQGRSSQIDHVILSRYGIFVVETKNYSGWIHGAENSRYWTQSIYHYKLRFPNPIKQNWSHIYALKDILRDFHGVVFHPIVVFAGGAELKNVYSTVRVIYLEDLVAAIRQTDETVMSDEQVSMIAETLELLNVTDRVARKHHVKNTRERKEVTETLEDDLVCPKCGGNMVSRAGKYGRFYGCSNYPRCRHTLPIG